MRHSARHRVSGRHRAEPSLGVVALRSAQDAVALAHAVQEAALGFAERASGPASSWPRRTVVLAGAAALALSLMGLHDAPARAAAAPAPHASVVVAEPRTVSYTVPTDVAAAASTPRDAYSVTILPPPETPDRVSWPVPATTPISSPFGPRVAPCDGCATFHHGIDLVPGEGTPVAAIARGTVVEVGTDGTAELGVYVIIQHIIKGQTVQSVYGHLLLGSMPLQVGDHVARAQQIGLVGDTGESTGPHLHFGILIDGQAVDPVPWMAAHVDS